MKFARLRLSLLSLGAVVALVIVPAQVSAAARPAHVHIDCSGGRVTCTEVADSEAVFGEGVYVGHDEPSTLFYSKQAGAGNRNQWLLVLPKDPPPVPNGNRSYNFQLHPAFWFGMAMCDTQSAPHPVAIHKCKPDSDKNITSDANIANHAGTAFMEMQFYPPGWVKWPPGNSCDSTRWCAALNIDSLSIDYPSGTQLNDFCRLNVTGVEPVNFAFITHNGVPQAPPNPVESTGATFTPDPAVDLMMNSGDQILTTMHDTEHGLRIDIRDLTTGQSGFMVTSAANGFGQVKFAPNPSTECTNIPYDFHPMYSTSSENTRVPWAAHSYNIAFSDEIGHFDYCSVTLGGTHSCNRATGLEGVAGDQEARDADDGYCFKASESSLVPIQGCQATNGGFDGVPYQQLWPDGNPDHPTTILFSSPLTGRHYDRNYERVAFEADLPRIEAADVSNTSTPCNRDTGQFCTLIPLTDDNVPANFYPWFTAAQNGQQDGGNRAVAASEGEGGCLWTLGANIPGLTTKDFGKNAEYGALVKLTYPATGGNGATLQRYNDFRQIMSHNPCPAGGAGEGGGN